MELWPFPQGCFIKTLVITMLTGQVKCTFTIAIPVKLNLHKGLATKKGKKKKKKKQNKLKEMLVLSTQGEEGTLK